jgi:hypothetical protein
MFFIKLIIQITRTILVFAGAEGKSADLPGILGAISVSKRLRASLRFNKFDQVPQLECPAPKLKKKVLE